MSVFSLCLLFHEQSEMHTFSTSAKDQKPLGCLEMYTKPIKFSFRVGAPMGTKEKFKRFHLGQTVSDFIIRSKFSSLYLTAAVSPSAFAINRVSIIH